MFLRCSGIFFWELSNYIGGRVIHHLKSFKLVPKILAETVLNYFGSCVWGGVLKKCLFLYSFVLLEDTILLQF